MKTHFNVLKALALSFKLTFNLLVELCQHAQKCFLFISALRCIISETFFSMKRI